MITDVPESDGPCQRIERLEGLPGGTWSGKPLQLLQEEDILANYGQSVGGIELAGGEEERKAMRRKAVEGESLGIEE